MNRITKVETHVTVTAQVFFLYFKLASSPMDCERMFHLAGFQLHSCSGSTSIYINYDASLVLEYDSNTKQSFLTQLFVDSIDFESSISFGEVEV